MKGSVINGIHSGYVVWDPEPTLPELKHAGEEWAFPEWATSIHSHPFHELHLQLTGSTEWETADGALTVERNMLVGIAPHIRHKMRPLGPRAHHFIYCSLDIATVLRRFNLPGDHPFFTRPSFLIQNAEELVAPFTTLSREIRQRRTSRRELIELCIGSIALMLHRVATTEGEEEPPDEPFDPLLIARMKRFIGEHLNERVSIEQLAQHLNVSRSTLFEVTRRELGKSPAAYQMECRMEVARKMLQTAGLPLTQIAHELGFNSSQHFSTAFRKLFGQTPSQYRASFHTQP